MGFDLFGVNAEFQTEWVAVAPRWVATKGHHFEDECVVAIDLNDRVTAAWQRSDDRLKQRLRIDQEMADLAENTQKNLEYTELLSRRYENLRNVIRTAGQS